MRRPPRVTSLNLFAAKWYRTGESMSPESDISSSPTYSAFTANAYRPDFGNRTQLSARISPVQTVPKQPLFILTHATHYSFFLNRQGGKK